LCPVWQNGWIVWINGPFPAGLYSDCRITVECGLLDNLQPDEKIIVDRGYPGHNDIFVQPGGPNALYAQMKRDIRACHETINQLFKECSILNNHFWYPVKKHGMVFEAIANIVQLCIEQDAQRPFMVYYDDTIFQNYLIHCNSHIVFVSLTYALQSFKNMTKFQCINICCWDMQWWCQQIATIYMVLFGTWYHVPGTATTIVADYV